MLSSKFPFILTLSTHLPPLTSRALPHYVRRIVRPSVRHLSSLPFPTPSSVEDEVVSSLVRSPLPSSMPNNPSPIPPPSSASNCWEDEAIEMAGIRMTCTTKMLFDAGARVLRVGDPEVDGRGEEREGEREGKGKSEETNWNRGIIYAQEEYAINDDEDAFPTNAFSTEGKATEERRKILGSSESRKFSEFNRTGPTSPASKLNRWVSKSRETMPCYRTMDFEGVDLPDADVPIKLDRDHAVRLYECMTRVKVMDHFFYEAQRQGRFSFYLTCQGEEAAIVAAAAALEDEDEIFAQYREQGALLWRGHTFREFADQLVGNVDGHGLGRQMPVHHGSRLRRFHTISSPLGTQILHAVGSAYVAKLDFLSVFPSSPPSSSSVPSSSLSPSAPNVHPHSQKPRVSAVFFGEGAASTGDAHAAMNFAAVLATPTLFICRNNGYAISTAAAEQYRGDGVACRGPAYGIPSIRVDGGDARAVLNAVRMGRRIALGLTTEDDGAEGGEDLIDSDGDRGGRGDSCGGSGGMYQAFPSQTASNSEAFSKDVSHTPPSVANSFAPSPTPSPPSTSSSSHHPCSTQPPTLPLDWRGGPVLIELVAYRYGHHSTSDDSTRYRSTTEIQKWSERDPVSRLRKWMERKGWWDHERERELVAGARAEVLQALHEAEKKPLPSPESMFDDVFYGGEEGRVDHDGILGGEKRWSLSNLVQNDRDRMASMDNRSSDIGSPIPLAQSKGGSSRKISQKLPWHLEEQRERALELARKYPHLLEPKKT